MNKIEINVPQGFQIDIEKSDLSKGLIEFKPIEEKKLTYEDVAGELFYHKDGYFLDKNGKVNNGYDSTFKTSYNDPNNATSKEQLECLMAYNKLRNVAEYLNKKTIFNWTSNSKKYFIFYDHLYGIIKVSSCSTFQASDIHFVSKELAEQAISILGEEEIKKALFIY